MSQIHDNHRCRCPHHTPPPCRVQFHVDVLTTCIHIDDQLRTNHFTFWCSHLMARRARSISSSDSKACAESCLHHLNRHSVNMRALAGLSIRIVQASPFVTSTVRHMLPSIDLNSFSSCSFSFLIIFIRAFFPVKLKPS